MLLQIFCSHQQMLYCLLHLDVGRTLGQYHQIEYPTKNYITLHIKTSDDKGKYYLHKLFSYLRFLQQTDVAYFYLG